MACENCDPQYTWLPYSGNVCYRTTTTAAIPPQYPISLIGTYSSLFSAYGARFFGIGSYNLNGAGTVVAYSQTPFVWTTGEYIGSDFQFTGNSINKGPMNRCALWANQFNFSNNPYYPGAISTAPPFSVWLGFSNCFSVPTSKFYYIGMGGDNNIRIVIDGIEIVNTYLGNNGNVLNFRYWNVYPVFIPAGTHIIQVFGESNEQLSAFGCEIYDNTLGQLTAATSYSNLNIVYTTSGQTTAVLVQDLDFNQSISGYTCPPGYVFGCGECYSYEFCNLYPPRPSCSAITFSQTYLPTQNIQPESTLFNNRPWYLYRPTGTFAQYSIIWCPIINY